MANPEPVTHQRIAECPAPPSDARDPTDFQYINKAMVCCHICRLIKNREQFDRDGCDNCAKLLGDGFSPEDYTTPQFSGMISVMEPSTSWASKWLHLGKLVPGCYALVVNDDPLDELQDYLENKGVMLKHS